MGKKGNDMIANDHDDLRDQIPAYALDSLDAAEAADLALHLEGCPTCRDELVAFRAVVDALALAARDADPSPTVRRRLLATAAADRAARTARPRGRSIFRPARRAWAVYALAALAIVLVGGLLWVTFGAAGGLRSPRAVILNPTEDAPGASGELQFSRDSRAATLTVVGLPVLPDAQQYQLWLVRDGVRDSGAIFSVNENGWAETPVTLLYPAADYERFGITIEPAGGSPGPTGEGVLRSAEQ
jgi:anti-sigma-K factor RskA